MNSPLVSVVVATYNMAAHLRSAITSVLNQTYDNFEVIVIDDGSTDHTGEVLLRFEDEPRVRVFQQSNQGQPRAKNVGIERARGDFIGFCDADDMWHPDKLTKQIPCFATSDRIGVVYSDFELRTIEGRTVPHASRRYHAGRVLDELMIFNFVPFSTALIRRKSLDHVGRFNESYPMGIDWDLWLRMAVHYDFCFVDVVTCSILTWEGQMSKNYRGRYKWAFRILTDFLLAHPTAVSKRTAAKAWADMYVGRGKSLRIQEGARMRALGDYFRALACRPGYLPAWRAIAGLCIGR